MVSQSAEDNRFSNCTLCGVDIPPPAPGFWDSLCMICTQRLYAVRHAPVSLPLDAKIPTYILELITREMARECTVVPVGFRNPELVIAVVDLHDIELLDKLRFVLNRDLYFVQADPEWIRAMIHRYYSDS